MNRFRSCSGSSPYLSAARALRCHKQIAHECNLLAIGRPRRHVDRSLPTEQFRHTVIFLSASDIRAQHDVFVFRMAGNVRSVGEGTPSTGRREKCGGKVAPLGVVPTLNSSGIRTEHDPSTTLTYNTKISYALVARYWQTRWTVSRWPSFRVRNSKP